MYLCVFSTLTLIVVQALLRVKYLVTQLGIRKEFAHRSASDVDAVIEDLVAQEKTLRAKKVRRNKRQKRHNTSLVLGFCRPSLIYNDVRPLL